MVSVAGVSGAKFLPFSDKRRFSRDLVLLLLLTAIAVTLYLRKNDFFKPRAPTLSNASHAATDVDRSKNELDLTFTQRSPLSGRLDLASRMRLNDDSLAPDYYLSKCPFKVYVPPVDPKEPLGILVYLGYKNSVSVAQNWEPTLDQKHLIFITPVCHSGQSYPPQVPAWQMLGLAFDAVDNLRRQYIINPHRIYLMAWEGGMQTCFASADIFTGFIIVYDAEYFRTLSTPAADLYYQATLEPPSRAMLRSAMHLPIVLIGESFTDSEKPSCLVYRAMCADGFLHLHTQVLSLSDDLHYPNMKADWFADETLPFLDGGATTQQAKKAQ